MRAFLSLLAIGVVASATPVDAQTHWFTLGSTTVGIATDRATIHVRGSRRIQHVRLCVTRNSIRLHSFRVAFTRAGDQLFRMNRHLRQNQCTLAATLRGGRQNIHTVWVGFARVPQNARPVIRVEGR